MLTLKTIFNELRWSFFPQKNPRPNLGLHGDLDDVEILEGAEEAFGIQISDEQAESMRNVGDFFDTTRVLVSQNGGELTWLDFTKVIEPHGTLAASLMTRETEFFIYIYDQDKK